MVDRQWYHQYLLACSDILEQHHLTTTAVSILSVLLFSCHAQHNEAFFNRTSYVRLQTPISLHSHTGLSFRTCHGGDLFVQHINTSKISLEVRSDGLVFMAELGGRRYESRLNERLLDNSWHYVNLLYRLGNLTLSVAGHQQEGGEQASYRYKHPIRGNKIMGISFKRILQSSRAATITENLEKS
ncbi:unnamed protein product, partial [Timema podura]|nr:unnamed protein product [Timema podura]